MVEELSAQMAAMRTAVSAAVEQTEARLAPSAVEERLPVSLLLDELLPMRRKARLWDLYQRTHGALMAERTDSQRDGQADAKSGGKDGKAGVGSGVRELFNRAFTRAYEAEVARLHKDRH